MEVKSPDTVMDYPAASPLPVARPSAGAVGERPGRLGGWLGFNGLMLLPALLLMGVLLLYPAAGAFRVALQNWTGFGPQGRYVGVRNFELLLGDLSVPNPNPERSMGLTETLQRWGTEVGDVVFKSAFANSVLWMIVGGLGHFFFAFVLAVGLQDPKLRAKRFFQTLIIFPMFISAIGVAMLWKQLYDPTRGMINLLLAVFGLADPIQATPAWLDPAHGIYPILLVSIWGGVGGQVILLLAGLRRIPASLYEAARVDGANETQCFFRISLPLMRDILIIALTLWIIGSLQVFGLVQGLLGPNVEPKMHVISTYMFQLAFNNRDNIYLMGQATAMAVMLVLFTLLLVGALLGTYRLVFGKERLEY